MMAILKFFILFFIGINQFNFGNAIDFPNHRFLDQDQKFELYWAFDNETITFQMHVASKGWAGLGFSPNGGMADADIVTFGVDVNGNKFISDRHADKNGYPPEDAHQDYFLDELNKTDDKLIATFHRKRNTCDPEDYPLTDDTTRVIFAMNDEIPKSKEKFSQHTYKSTVSMQFFSKAINTPDGQPPEPGAVWMDFKVEKVPVPDDRDTLYYCKILGVPRSANQTHIIKIEPMIQKENLDVVHHIIVYICTSGSPNITRYINIGHECYEPEKEDVVQNGFSHCQAQTLSAWAVGGQSITYPKDVGVPLHNVNEDMFVMIQMHYNNPQLHKGRVDSSGMRIWLTEKLRPIEAGQVQIGSPVNTYTTYQILPPQTSQFTTYVYCNANCTFDLPAGGVNLIGGLLHTHLTGRKIRLLHYRDGVQLPNILSDEHFDFNYQDYRSEAEPVVILPGDDIVMECEYSTVGRNRTTFSGLPTSDEMCLAYIDYYPAVYRGFSCFSMPDWGQVFAAIGFDPKKISNTTLHGKNIMQYLREDFVIDWSSPGRAQYLQGVVRNGVHQVGCYKNPLNATRPDEGFRAVYQDGYPNVTKPLEPKDDCKSTPTAAPATTPAPGTTGAPQTAAATTSATVTTTVAATTAPAATTTTAHSSGISYKKTNILLYFISFITLLCYIRL